MKPRCAAPDALSVLPLLHGLERSQSSFETVRDWPSQVALDLAQEKQNTRIAFISPLDYARHGGSYRILPGIALSCPEPAGIAVLRVRPDARAIRTLAADPRTAADIVLATIVLAEKFPSLEDSRKKVAILPSQNPSTISFDRCDAVLEYRPYPDQPIEEGFPLDLYEEWRDLTGFPYVAGFWVMREEDWNPEWADAVGHAAKTGTKVQLHIAEDEARRRGASMDLFAGHIANVSYELTADHEESVREFFEYAFFHGMIGDIPELRYYDSSEKVE